MAAEAAPGGTAAHVSAWLDDYRRHWEESFERLDAYLREVDAPGQPSDEQEQTDGHDDD